jgi:MYXO-CTERM domain-containing protein
MRAGGRTGLARLPGAAFTGALLAILLALEAAARTCRTDGEDALALAALVLVAVLVRRRHAADPLPWVSALGRVGRSVASGVRRETMDVGIDLRGRPPFRPGFPPILGSLLAVACAGALLAALVPAFGPLAVRTGVRTVSAVAWVALLGAAWAVFAVGSLHLLYVAFALTHDEFVRSHRGPGPRSRWVEVSVMAAWVAGVVGAWAFLPGWTAAVVHGACLAACALALALPGGPDVPLLWRTKGEDGGVRAARWRTHTLAGTAGPGLALAGTTVFVHGAALRGGDASAVESVLPLTSGFASLFAWSGAAALAAWTILVARLASGARRRTAPGATAPEAWVADALPADRRRAAAAALAARGIRVRFAPGTPRRTAVPLVLGDGPAPAGALRIPPGALGTAETARRIARRHELRARRILLRGLESLFRGAAARKFERGTGFWVAPWHWFCIGLSRDEDERTVEWGDGTLFLGTVGPAYARVFPAPALAIVRRAMDDLAIDLVFVEDGVGFRRFRRVLRMAFELHDMFGSKGRAEEAHFAGLPGVRVLIHEVAPDAPRGGRLRGYPEPEYRTVGRARVLHVFRDRGEAGDPVDSPRSRRGAPLGV